jgi:predicted transcriptional regulator
MQRDQAVYDDVQFLTGSPHRHTVLSALCDETARPSELCEDIDATRTTIQRILAGFRERQWVVKHDGDYRATVTGQLVCERYESLYEAVTRAQNFGSLAANLGPIADDLPPSALERGQLTVSRDGNPLAVLSRFTEWLETVEGEFHAISPVVAQPFNDIGAELLSEDTTIEFVIDSAVLEQSQANYESALEFGLNHDQMTIYVHEPNLDIGVAFDDERCCVVAYDDDNNLKALLEGGESELYEWTTALFERYRDRAVPLTELIDIEESV